MRNSDLKLFSLDSGAEFVGHVANILGTRVSRHEERDFEDGEHKIRPLEDVTNKDVFLVQSIFGEPCYSVNDKLVRLLFLLGALRDAGASRLSVIAPYFCYARKDRRTKWQDPLSLRYVAQLFEAIGIDTLVVMDIHNQAAFENAFRCRTIHLSAGDLFADFLVPQFGDQPVAVASPDIGGAKRAEAFRELLEARLERPIGSALMEKHRSEGIVSGDRITGDIEGKYVLVLDDLIAGGTTMRRAAQAFKAAGATSIHALATHGVFGRGATENLVGSGFDSIICTNSIPLAPPGSLSGLIQLDTAPLVADLIRRLHDS